MRILKIRKQILTVLAIVMVIAMSGSAQTDAAKTGAGKSDAANTDSGQSNAGTSDAGKTASPNADEILSFLNQTIVWSGQLATQQQLVNEPSDAVFLNDSRQVSSQIVGLAFDFARARA
ncbi:MAG TPA: hypothetical protein VKU42_01185, partial [Candidatus Angelobacter sp.]|nr:hypothetical protein [Candidatus Angelobacter sp.]